MDEDEVLIESIRTGEHKTIFITLVERVWVFCYRSLETILT